MSVFLSSADLLRDSELHGPARIVSHKGRNGLHALSTRTRLKLPGAGTYANIPRGAMTYWVLPLEDLSNATYWGHYRDLEPDFNIYTLLSDHRDLRNVGVSHFALLWQSTWWRPLMARFIAGLTDRPAKNKPSFGPCELHLRALCWYQIGVTWDREAGRFDLYLNGILVGTANRLYPQYPDEAGPDLFAGNTCFALGELNFNEGFWSKEDFARAYAKSCAFPEPEVHHELEATHGGMHFHTLGWEPSAEWNCQLDLPLTRDSDLEEFYIQGNKEAPRITEEGLLIETPDTFPPPLNSPDNDDHIQVYLHSWKTFEGDIALDFEFKPLQNHGLALVMVHASGMQREDFMKDYPLREIGSMRMVCWENVRNYHWEFWRCMEGIRSDTATHAFFKNPWFRGLAYRAMPELMEVNKWHRIQLVQEGERFRGMVDGVLIFDICDEAFQNHGPVYHFGHVSLRNMWGSRCLWRNLRVHTRTLPYETLPFGEKI